MRSSFDRGSTNVTRRELLVHGSLVAAGFAAGRTLAFAQTGDTELIEVETTHGRIRGARSNGLATFKGVPYAGSVTGANRFKAAAPPLAWTGVRDALAMATTAMVLKQPGLEPAQWRRLLETPVDKLLDVQGTLGQSRPGPLMPNGGRKGISGNPAPGGFGPVLDGRVLPHHPFDPTAPAISRDKPLIVGYNRDEMNFLFGQNRATDVYTLTDATLKARLEGELGTSAAAVLAAYRRSRPDASPPDLYVAITSAPFAGIGSATIAERKHAQRGAPAYMYVFTHESTRLIPGTNHTYGAAHATEIVYKFNNVGGRLPGQPPPAGGMFDDPRPASVQTGRHMSEFWSTFARTGRPAAEGQPAWPAYTTEQRATMFIDAPCRVVNDPFSLERQVWDTI